jgi:hypothetical protein
MLFRATFFASFDLLSSLALRRREAASKERLDCFRPSFETRCCAALLEARGSSLLRRDPEQHTQTFDNRRLSVSFRRSAGQKGRKRNACFASRNGRLRAAGRKPLILLRAPNQAFRGIVCFQGFNRRFISPFSRTRIFGPKSSGQTRPAGRRLGASRGPDRIIISTTYGICQYF